MSVNPPGGVRPPDDADLQPLHVELVGPGAAAFVDEYELQDFTRADSNGEGAVNGATAIDGERPRFQGELPPREALQALQIIIDEDDPASLRALARPLWLFEPSWNGAETPPTFTLQGTYSVLLASLPPVDSHDRAVIVFPHQQQEMEAIVADVDGQSRSWSVGLATWQGDGMEGPTDGRRLFYWRLGQ